MSNPNRVAFYAQRSWDVVSQERFCGVDGWREAERAYDVAVANKQPGQVVRKTQYRYGSRRDPQRGYTVTVYQRATAANVEAK